MKVSEHLTLAECIKSNTATRHGIDNTPTPEHLDAMQFLAKEVFEPVRSFCGNKPLFVSSFYRGEILNRKVKGSKSSQHCKGQAMDIDGDLTGIDNKLIFDFIRSELVFDQLIWEFGTDESPNWVHVSLRKSGNRLQVLQAYKDKNNRTKYRSPDF